MPSGTPHPAPASNFAREHDVRLAVRGNGHNIAGTALCDDGLVIYLSGMKGEWVDRRRQTVHAQPGLNWGELDREAQLRGGIVPGGIVSTTGISGLTLGGGGNFGVVTSLEYRLRPLGKVLAGLTLHPLSRAREVVDLFRELTASAPDELTAMLLLRTAPAAPFIPAHLHGTPVVGIAVCDTGAPEEAERRVRPLKQFGPPVVDTIAPKPFGEHQTLLDASQPPGRFYYWKSEYLHALTEAGRDVLLEHASRLPSPESSVLVFQLGGAVGRAGDCTTWARAFWRAMQPFGTGGVYVNFLTADEGEERTRAAYGGDKLARLADLKRRYDPENLFRVNRNIRPQP